jgi:hypothetical protein
LRQELRRHKDNKSKRENSWQRKKGQNVTNKTTAQPVACRPPRLVPWVMDTPAPEFKVDASRVVGVLACIYHAPL